jgi:TonB family protein
MKREFIKMLILITISLVLSHQLICAQSDICDENTKGVYWPVKTSVKRYYSSPHGTSVEYFNGDSLNANGKTYYKSITESKGAETKTTYLREENGDVYIYDAENKIEFLELSGNITPGYTWEKFDKSWKYTVIDTTSKIRTPYCEYKNLLNIKAEPIGETAEKYSDYYNLYYKRGVGLAGLHVSGKGYSFLSIDRTTAIERNWMAVGCENLNTEEKRQNCTAEKIRAFMNSNFKYSGELKKGIIAIQFEIDEQGYVQDAKITKTIDNTEEQATEVLRVVKEMKFVPREINGKPCKTWLTYPFAF